MFVDFDTGPRATIRDIKIGDKIAIEKTISESDVYLFAGICGDFSPNHINERYMKGSRFGTRIAQGALVVGFTSAAAAMFGIKYRVDGVSAGYDRLRFVKPVFFGDTIRIHYEIARIDIERDRAYAALKVTNQDDEVVLVGDHVLRFVALESREA
ncbi:MULTISPECIES: MaoC/PaaZ C-terminal domain-containing protein [unclassified Variovorax]|uniref:MaoC family dehydratase n=1 Tax=unclassified Variovorax TaxID=663243 RepID=UPI00076DF18D|nr:MULTISPECIES: MaoC/PaaZ C-terminal domain-containing protein [unclassified Variovorax]KWT97485.1 MaoC-like dehydratase [Variovorax sp. WDL1]PNG51679.1 (R)-specific enoyl-CoA hydratase [Variovorax sp. B2]PNG54295.1 (R)-specific enoyl-CoA hydratase [Variovorax sp. B4]VTV11784.1 Bifunctional protein PaaZ [Variovorax sp. WDL1]